MNLFEALKKTGWATKKSDPCKGRRYRASHRDIVDQDNSVANFSPVEIAIHDDWEPYKEPCKHEPKHVLWTDWNNVDPRIPRPALPFSQSDSGSIFIHLCKHCGVKLKAEKWVEA